ncbi:hypothetical protein SAY87_005348 [Trapa incisa]|uniref:Uncharacterized protein n=1 Tax=Trapa incisa TaxID=236973 RepID=A0AAN7K4L1_9MYRT|nr:hypothetical protein SAY87_005348 [Trapa incisa]
MYHINMQESTCEMRRAIVIRDRKLAMLSEKVNYHLLLFDSIEKEAQTVKQIVDNVNHLVSEKEELGMSVPEVVYLPKSILELDACSVAEILMFPILFFYP